MNPIERRAKQYFAIAGVTTDREAAYLLENFPENGGLDRPLRFGIGVLTNNHILKGGVRGKGQSAGKRRYPSRHDLRHIFTGSPKALNLIHFRTTDPRNMMLEQMTQVEMMMENTHGFQINMPWPDPEIFQTWRQCRLGLPTTIVLQCGRQAIDEVRRDPVELAERVGQYNGLADYVLIDQSDGTGTPLDPHFAIDCLAELYRRDYYIAYGVAGNLSALTMPKILAPVYREFPDISFDAESGVRNADDTLNYNYAKSYIAAGIALIAQHENAPV